MDTMGRERVTRLTDFHKAMFNLIFIVGIACAAVLAAFGFFFAGGIAVVTTFAAEVGNRAIWKRRFRQAPVKAFSEHVRRFKARGS